MARHASLEVPHQALSAELMQWGAPESAAYTRRSARTLAALVFGASTVVGSTHDPRTVAPAAAQAPAELPRMGAILPAHYRPSADRLETIDRVLVHARERIDGGVCPPRAVAMLALEIGRLQRDLGVRTADGMEECVGEAYASLEAVRRAVADVVVDAEDAGVVADALERASQLFDAA